MALDLKQRYETDKRAEIEGKWEPLEDGGRIKVARTGNPNFQKAYRRLPRPIKQQMEEGRLPTGKGDEILSDIMARTILLDWEGLADGGEEVPYSQENAKRLLVEYPDFRDFVWSIANSMETFRAEEREEDAKN